MASPVELGNPYIALGGAQEMPKENHLQKYTQRCKSAAKKAFDVLSLLSGVGLMIFGAVLIIGEKANVQPNRGAGLGGFFLGSIIAYGNYKHIRNW